MNLTYTQRVVILVSAIAVIAVGLFVSGYREVASFELPGKWVLELPNADGTQYQFSLHGNDATSTLSSFELDRLDRSDDGMLRLYQFSSADNSDGLAGVVASQNGRWVKVAEPGATTATVFTRRLSNPARKPVVTALSAGLSLGTEVVTPAAASDILFALATPPDPSLASLKSFEQAQFVATRLSVPSNFAGRDLATFVLDHTDDRNFTYLRLLRDLTVTAAVRDGVTILQAIGPRARIENGELEIQCSYWSAGADGGTATVRAGGALLESHGIPQRETKTAGFMGVAQGVEVLSLSGMPQPDIWFTDSFMRASAEADLWTSHGGRWEILGMQNPDKSSNPFSLLFTSADETVIDKFFERGKSEEEGIGIQIEPGPFGEKVRIIHVLDGPAKAVGIADGDLLVTVNDKPISGFDRSSFGELVKSSEETSLKLGIEREGEPMSFDVQQGVWKRSLARYKPDREYIGDGILSPTGIVVTGERFWSRYSMEASVKIHGTGSFAFILAWQDPENYSMVRWNSDTPPAGGAPNSVEFVRFVFGKEMILASQKAGGFFPNQNYRVRCEIDDQAGITSVSFTVDGHSLCTFEQTMHSGKVGIRVDNNEAVVVDDVVVSSRADERKGPVFISSFTNDVLMKYWADRKYDWVPKDSFANGKYWGRRGYGEPQEAEESSVMLTPMVNIHSYLGDVTVTLEKPVVTGRAKPGTLSICASIMDRHNGYTLSFDSAGKFTLRDSDEELATTVYPGSKLPESIVFSLNKRTLLVGDGTRNFMAAPVKNELTGGHVLFSGIANPFTDGRGISVSSPSTREYSFDNMPVEWETASGQWGTMNRWVCSPQWSYFGGRSNKLAAIWLKESLQGSMTFDFYVGFAMPSYTRMPLEKPADVGFTLGGNGKDLLSGLAWLLGHQLNEHSYSFSGGPDSEPDAMDFRFSDGDGTFSMEFHQRWEHVKIDLFGNKAWLYVNNALIQQMDLTDSPAEIMDRLAIWTLDNSILIARAHVSASVMEASEPLVKDFRVGPQGALNNFCDGDVFCRIDRAGRHEGSEVYEITPLRGGGAASFTLTADRVDLAQTPVLSLKFREENGPMYDLYFDSGMRTFKIGLLGGSEFVEEVQYIGGFDIRDTDDGWKHATVDIARQIQKYLPNWTPGMITNIRFSAGLRRELAVAGAKRNSSASRLTLSDLTFLPTAAVEEEPFAASISWQANGPVLTLNRMPQGVLSLALDGKSVAVDQDHAIWRKANSEFIVSLPETVPLAAEVQAVIKDGETVLFEGPLDVKISLSSPVIFERGGSLRSLLWDFDTSGFDLKPPSDDAGPRVMGFQRPVSATDLAIVDSGDPALGNCLRVLCTNQASVFGVRFPVNELLYRYPILAFNYRIPQKINLSLLATRGSASGRLALSSAGTSFFGSRDEAPLHKLEVSDEWLSDSLNLVSSFSKSQFAMGGMKVDDVTFSDAALYSGNFDGSYFMLDNVRFIRPCRWEDLPRLVLVAPEPLEVPSIKLFAANDKKPLTRTVRKPAQPLDPRILVFDPATEDPLEGSITITMLCRYGKRTLSLSRSFVVDSMPPVFKEGKFRIHPASGKLWVNLSFAETNGIDLESLRMTVDGVEVGREEMELDAVGNETISVRIATRFTEMLKANGKVLLELHDLMDYTGNRAVKPPVYLLEGEQGLVEPAKP